MTPEELAALDTWGRLDLVDEVVRLRAENAYLAPRQRAGQRIFNAVHSIDPAFADSVRATDVDPFYDDERCEAFLRAWMERCRAEARASGLRVAHEIAHKNMLRSLDRAGLPNGPADERDLYLQRRACAAEASTIAREIETLMEATK